MDGAETPHHNSAVNPHDFAGRKDLIQHRQGRSVLRVAKCRHQNGGIANIKIGIARRQTIFFIMQCRRHGKLEHAERLSFAVGCLLELLEVL